MYSEFDNTKLPAKPTLNPKALDPKPEPLNRKRRLAVQLGHFGEVYRVSKGIVTCSVVQWVDGLGKGSLNEKRSLKGSSKGSLRDR